MATDDLDALDDERAVELSSIAAIFPELVLVSLEDEAYKALIDIEVNLLTPLSVTFAPRLESHVANARKDEPTHNGTENALPSGVAKSAPEHAPGNAVELTHLPSVRCEITLPKGYPDARAPSVTMSCNTWLSDSRLRELESHAHTIWEELGKNVVLFDYLDWAAQLAQTGFGIVEGPEPKVLPRELETSMLDFDLRTKRAKFERETFECGVCLEPRKGAVCHRMEDCGHVFCIQCLQDFYTNCITEGDVANVKCMNPGCEKERLRHLPEKKRRKADLTLQAGELVAMKLEPAAVQRYLQMKKKKQLESDKNTIYCPRKWCQGAARTKGKEQASDDEDDEEDEVSEKNVPKRLSPADRLCVCSDCSFAFCSRCLNGWHGEYVACQPPRKTDELSAEEKATQDYLAMFSTRCPTCDSPVQKTMGCNHMICQLCRTHFCYLCSAYLLADNPYAHYNTRDQGCYQRLWVLEGGDYEGAPAAFPIEEIQGAAQENQVAPPVELDLEHLEIAGDFILFEDDDSSSEENDVAPPPAPMPPRGRGGGRGRGGHRGRGGGGRGRGGGPGVGGNRGLARGPPQLAEAEPAHDGRPLPAHEQHGLQRFLRLAMLDMEDEWDSDELDTSEEDHR